MFKQILTTLDGSEYSERALRYAGELATMAGAQIALLSVVQVASSTFETVDEDAARIRGAQALAYLEEKAQTLRDGGIPDVTTHVRFGQPALAITELARELHADLIAMSTQGLGADGHYTVGSVALKVLMSAPCPVLLVRINKPEPPKNVAEERWQSEGGANVG